MREEAQVDWLAVVAAGNAKARADNDLARAQEALAVAEEARRKAEVEQTSLLLELGAAKDEVSSLKSKVGKDKEAMEEDYQKALKPIFSYGYGCCVFKHNICGDQPKVPDGMHDSFDPFQREFFEKPRCPQQPLRSWQQR